MLLLRTVKNNKGGVTVCILQTTENLCCLRGEHKLPNWRFMQEISLESSSLLVPGTHWRIVQKWVKGGGREQVIVGKEMKRKWYVQSQGAPPMSWGLPQSSWNHLAGVKGAYLWTPLTLTCFPKHCGHIFGFIIQCCSASVLGSVIKLLIFTLCSLNVCFGSKRLLPCLHHCLAFTFSHMCVCAAIQQCEVKVMLVSRF